MWCSKVDDDKVSKMLDNLFIISTLLKTLFKYKTLGRYSKIPFSYYQVLLILRNAGTLPISKTGRLMCIKKQNMTYMTDKLVEKGLIKRVPDMNDRRVINITITNKGKECLSEWRSENIKLR